jgi:hypothetical protein
MAKTDKPLSAFERAVLGAVGDNRPLGCPDDPAASTLPLLWQFLSTTQVGKDRVKQPATLTLRLGPGGVLVTLNDRDLALSIDCSCQHLEAAFMALESALASGNPIIRTHGKREPQLRKRRQS